VKSHVGKTWSVKEKNLWLRYMAKVIGKDESAGRPVDSHAGLGCWVRVRPVVRETLSCHDLVVDRLGNSGN
jgi:hypothetical protein